jgi:RecG-like helicase
MSATLGRPGVDIALGKGSGIANIEEHLERRGLTATTEQANEILARVMQVSIENKRLLTSQLRKSLPWELTGAQMRALREIVGDMTSPRRMHRLLQGDVGSGKTIVALFAALLAIENGYQAAIMAPTELLAEQHFRILTVHRFFR